MSKVPSQSYTRIIGALQRDGWAVFVEKDYMACGRSIIVYGLS